MKIEVKNISKKFKNIQVLNDINVVFESGNIYSLIGKNGSCKSVFFKILCGFYYPTTGTVTFDKINYLKNHDFPKNIGVLIEHPSFIDDLTGYENLKLLAKIQNKIGDKEN